MDILDAVHSGMSVDLWWHRKCEIRKAIESLGNESTFIVYLSGGDVVWCREGFQDKGFWYNSKKRSVAKKLSSKDEVQEVLEENMSSYRYFSIDEM